MKITQFSVFRFSCPLIEPVKTFADKMLSHREGLIIQIGAEDGSVGFGEVSPLPGVSRESLDDCTKQLTKLKKKILNCLPPPHLEKLDGKFEKWFKDDRLSPSVEFGIETAILSLLANSRHTSLCQLLAHAHHETPHEKVRLNGLLQGPTVIEAQAKEMLTKGFQAIKMKVGGTNIQDDIAAVRKMIAAIGPNAMLRLDANQKWNLKDAIAFAGQVEYAAIEYIEEPFKNVEEIPEFYATTMIPVALDESVRASKFEDLKGLDGVEVFVLKPTLLGGIEKLWQLTARAKSLGITVVISSSFESGIGLLTLAHLSACLCNTYAGLDTQKFFKENLIEHPFEIQHGKIDMRHARLNRTDIKNKLWKEVQL